MPTLTLDEAASVLKTTPETVSACITRRAGRGEVRKINDVARPAKRKTG